MKKVLIISYYRPPAGGPGVQRVLKFAKYLPRFGWQPIVLTVEGGEYPAFDLSMEKEIPQSCKVYRVRAFEPGRLYRQFVGLKKGDKIPVAVLTEKKPGWKKRFANWVRLNLFLPDAKILWKYRAVQEGKRIIAREKPNVLFSSSPPPTVHLIAKALARHAGLKWVADFRDPWTNIYHYSELNKSQLAKKMDQHLEYSVLKNATKITFVNQGFFNYSEQSNMHLLPNGFDPEDVDDHSENDSNDKFTIRYVGSLKPRQYVDSFFTVLKNLSLEKKFFRTIRLEFIGNVYPEVRQAIADKNISLEINFLGYLEHDKALKYVMHADLLLLVIGPSAIADKLFSGKIFEYIMARKPILAYGPIHGAASVLLSSTHTGKMYDYKDYEGPENYIVEHYNRWQSKDAYSDYDQKEIAKYDRKILTQKLVQIFEEII